MYIFILSIVTKRNIQILKPYNIVSPNKIPKVISFNVCVMHRGINFSKNRNDKKRRRMLYIAELCDKYDIIMIQEMWATQWGVRNI